MSSNDDTDDREQRRPVMNRIGERIRLTELHRRGELTDEQYREQLEEVDGAWRAGQHDNAAVGELVEDRGVVGDEDGGVDVAADVVPGGRP